MRKVVFLDIDGVLKTSWWHSQIMILNKVVTLQAILGLKEIEHGE